MSTRQNTRQEHSWPAGRFLANKFLRKRTLHSHAIEQHVEWCDALWAHIVRQQCMDIVLLTPSRHNYLYEVLRQLKHPVLSKMRGALHYMPSDLSYFPSCFAGCTRLTCTATHTSRCSCCCMVRRRAAPLFCCSG